MKKYLVGISTLNEGDKIRRVVAKFNDYERYDVFIVDDGSTDGSMENLPKHPAITIVRNPVTKGAGYSTRQLHEHGRKNKYLATIPVSGNDKDSPEDVEKFIQAIEEGYDFVQGSRYLKGGRYSRMPLYRVVATRFMHPLLFSLITGRWITDSTNGFRAVRSSLLEDARLNLYQDWLNSYEFEPYLFYKAIKLGYKVKEVPVIKIYPPAKEGYTKMKPWSGWWSILRPLIFLGLGIKK